MKKLNGIVYSTNPDFFSNDANKENQDTLPPERQILHVWLETKGRKGKTATIIKGFKGNADDLEKLTAKLKKHCGTGGSCKNGEILIQGNLRDKILACLSSMGYITKKAGS
jgi:translation initiation factor 1